MIGVRSDLLAPDTTKWRAVIPGRLLHWRGQIGRRQMDILAVYQTAIAHVSGDQQQELMRQRHKLWKSMDDVLASLPFRSSVVVMGDLNATLSPLAEVAGCGILKGSEVPWIVQERAELMQVLKRHRLVALNTWGRPRFTYHHPNGRSQIDYILVRKQLADTTARACIPLEPPIAAWRSAGHKPLAANFRLNWSPWKQSFVKPPTCPVRAPPLETLLEEPSPNLIALQQAVKQQLDTPPLKPDYPQLRVVQIWQGNRNPTGCTLLSGRTAHNDGQTMTPEEIAQDKKRRLRQLARQRRRQRLLETLAKAQEAFQAGDIRLHYQFIRKLAPKAYRRKLCLKSDSGDLLSNTEELCVAGTVCQRTCLMMSLSHFLRYSHSTQNGFSQSTGRRL